MSFAEFQDWAFLGLLSGAVYVLHAASVAVRAELKELASAISLLKDELASLSGRIGTNEAVVHHLAEDIRRIENKIES